MDTSARDCMVLFDTSVEGKLACGWDSGVLHQRTRTVKAGRVAETVADFGRAKEIFEKLYPGCELLEIGAKKSRWASGVYVHALMRRVDETGRTR